MLIRNELPMSQTKPRVYVLLTPKRRHLHRIRRHRNTDVRMRASRLRNSLEYNLHLAFAVQLGWRNALTTTSNINSNDTESTRTTHEWLLGDHG